MLLKIMNRPLEQVVNICQKSYVETLIVISTTCFGLLCHGLNGSSASALPPIKNAMSFKQLVVYDCMLYNLSILYALIQVTRSTRKVTKNLNSLAMFLNVSVYFSLNLMCYFCITLLFIPDKSYVFRFGFPTLVFMFDWKKCVHVSKSLVTPRSDFEQRLLHNTSALGFRLFNKMFFKCMFLVLGLYCDVEELSQLSLLTLLAVGSNSITFVTLFPALNSLQQDMQTGKQLLS